MEFKAEDYVEVFEMKNPNGTSHHLEDKYKGKRGFIKKVESGVDYPYTIKFDDENLNNTLAFNENDLILVERGESKTIANKTIGQIKGNYKVLYKNPNAISQRGVGELQCTVYQFEGECENFTGRGLCAFRDKEDKMLLVHFNDIVQLSPIN